MAGEVILNIKYKGVVIYVEFRDIFIKLEKVAFSEQYHKNGQRPQFW